MEKIRVAFFADILLEDFDGAAKTMFQLINRIPKNEFEFLFITGTGPDKINGFECFCIPSLTIPFNNTYKMAWPVFAENKIKEKVNQFQPDVIHIATPSLLGQFAAKLAVQWDIPVISIYHTHFVSYIDYYLKQAPTFFTDFVKYKAIEAQKTFYNQCTQINVASESISKELIASGIEADKIKIWKRGINTSLFSPAKRNKEIVEKLTGNNKPNILFVSRLVWEKNLETLMRIYDQLETKNFPYNLIIAGDGVAERSCKRRMKAAIFTGKIKHEELSKLYASCDVFLFTSISEAFGNVVVEAMASGLPCVIANGGGSKDFIENGVNGFLCDPYNEHDYLQKINRLMNSQQLWNQFAEKGREDSFKYDWDEIVTSYFNDLSALAEAQYLTLF